MRDANPRAHVTRLISERNYVGAYLYLKEAELERAEYLELVGSLTAAIIDELSKTRRDDRERIYYLRSVLAWIFRDVPGLSSLYREQIRSAKGGSDLLEGLFRGVKNVGDVASGRKTMSDGIQDAAEDARRNVEDAADAVRGSDAGARIGEFLSSAERGIKTGIEQLGAFFRDLNTSGSDGEPESDVDQPSDTEQAARADADRDVEDAEYEEMENPNPESDTRDDPDATAEEEGEDPAL
jgi:hypothetical protein